MNHIQISSDAVADLADAYDFYEKQEIGIGDYFLTQIKADIDGLKITGGIHRVVYRDLHRLLSKKFPYSIFYKYTNGQVLVVAVVDNRKDPAWIKQHLVTVAQ